MFKPPKEYRFTKEQEKKVFNLVLRNTLEKDINWEMGVVMFTGKSGNNKLLFYEGESGAKAICIQNKNEYTHFFINKQQAEILISAINGKGKFAIESNLNHLEQANDYYIED
jgi:hypothetical protein